MKKIKLAGYFGIISMLLVIASAVCGAISIADGKLFVDTSSIIYNVSEDHSSGTAVYEVTEIQVTIVNNTMKSYENENLVLRYCRSDSYPEGYSSPVVFSIKPLERKTITITEFRNSWTYNEEYHIECDSIDMTDSLNTVHQNIEVETLNDGSQIELIKASIVIFLISLTVLILSIVIILNLRKKMQNVEIVSESDKKNNVN